MMHRHELVSDIYEKLQDSGLLTTDLPFSALSTGERRAFEEVDELIQNALEHEKSLRSLAGK